MNQTRDFWQPTKVVADKIGELVSWAVLNTSEHFTCEVEFTAHVQWVQYNVCYDGWHTSSSKCIDGKLMIANYSESEFCERVDDLLKCLKASKRKSDKKWSEENQKLENEKIRLARIERLRDKLAELEDEEK